MAKVRMGWEGKMWIGTLGSEATTNQLTKHRDVTVDLKPEYGDTSAKGDGSGPVINSKGVAAIDWTCKMNYVYNDGDTYLQTMIDASAAGTAIALRMKRHATGKGYNGDVNVEVSEGQPFKGETTFDITFTPNNDSRVPLFNN